MFSRCATPCASECWNWCPVLAAAVVLEVIFRVLKLPALLGYLLVGALIGPHSIGLIADNEEARYLAEFRVVFLMFRSAWNSACQADDHAAHGVRPGISLGRRHFADLSRGCRFVGSGLAQREGDVVVVRAVCRTTSKSLTGICCRADQKKSPHAAGSFSRLRG